MSLEKAKKILYVILKAAGRIGIGALILGVVTVIGAVIYKIKEKQTLAIIGGADGPTAVFVAGKVGNPGLLGAVVGIVVAVLGVLMLMKKKK